MVETNETTPATGYGCFEGDHTPEDFEDDDDGMGFDQWCCCYAFFLGPECCYAVVTCWQVVLGYHTDCECEYCTWCLQDVWNGCI